MSFSYFLVVVYFKHPTLPFFQIIFCLMSQSLPYSDFLLNGPQPAFNFVWSSLSSASAFLCSLLTCSIYLLFLSTSLSLFLFHLLLFFCSRTGFVSSAFGHNTAAYRKIKHCLTVVAIWERSASNSKYGWTVCFVSSSNLFINV